MSDWEEGGMCHRAGEGAPFTGLKPAGLDHGPVVPVAERAIESGNVDELAKAGVVVPEIVDLQLAKYLTNRGTKRLNFISSQEFSDPTGIQEAFLPREKMGLP